MVHKTVMTKEKLARMLNDYFEEENPLGLSESSIVNSLHVTHQSSQRLTTDFFEPENSTFTHDLNDLMFRDVKPVVIDSPDVTKH